MITRLMNKLMGRPGRHINRPDPGPLPSPAHASGPDQPRARPGAFEIVDEFQAEVDRLFEVHGIKPA
jgi:hypothetical protein